MDRVTVSIIINNYNYGRFLREAIDSALCQDYPNTEVVVVDDGSDDYSRDIILSYGDRVRPVLKENGGQASALNAGAAVSQGDVICFLDSDDIFYPEKVSKILEAFVRYGLKSKPIMVHHLAGKRNEAGIDIDDIKGKIHESPKNLLSFVKRHRFMWFEAGPTSTLAINRALLELLFPIPEAGVRISADDFVVFGAFLLADVYSIGDKLSGYRIHDKNNWEGTVKRKTPEFLCILEGYLNNKLAENNIAAVVDWRNSIYAWQGLVDERRWLELSGRMLKVLLRDHDRYTTQFAYYTVMTIGRQLKKALLLRISWNSERQGSPKQ